MFVVDQEQRRAYRGDKIVSVRVYYTANGYRDGWVYATIEGLPKDSGEVELGIYDKAETANAVARELLEALTDGYPELYYMPGHDWDPTADAEDKAYTGTMEDEPYSDEDLDRMLMNAKPDNAP